MKRRSLLLSLALFFTTLDPLTASAQTQLTTEQRFQDMFVTAGYATAFGAALGAAALSFSGNPERHLRYVAVGASLGFIGGSLIGSYIVFAPTIAASEQPEAGSLLADSMPSGKIAIMPHIDTRSHRLSGIAGGMTLFNF